VAKAFLRFAYSVMFFMLHQYYWCCDFDSACRRSATNKKQSAKAPRFAYNRRVQLRIKYYAKTIGATSLVLLHLYLQNLPIYWAVLTGNGNKANIRWRRIKKAKKCPAPRSVANTQRLAFFLLSSENRGNTQRLGLLLTHLGYDYGSIHLQS
jgi:hypothetical protein